jgi:hypothetical protein
VAVAVGGLSFGAIYGQQHQWRDAVGPGALIVGAVAAVLFVVLMARGRHPLVPLGLFRSRNFAVTNLSTFLIYGALYVVGYQQSIFSQGTLLLQRRGGRLHRRAGRSAARRAVVARGRPRSPARAAPVHGRRPGADGRRHPVAGPDAGEQHGLEPPARRPASWLPPASYLTDFLPSTILFGLGLAITVAPLTTALMASVPEARAGLGSAVNNAISRVGPQLAGALIFVAITGAFYADLSNRVPGIDTSSDQLRQNVSPLNRPDQSVSPTIVPPPAKRPPIRSTWRWGWRPVLLLAGAATNALGIRDPDRAVRDGAAKSEASPAVAADSSPSARSHFGQFGSEAEESDQMSEADNRRAVERLFEGLNAKNPWSDERSLHRRFGHGLPAIGRGHPRPPIGRRSTSRWPTCRSIAPYRTIASGEIVVSEAILDYGENDLYNTVFIFECRDGKIARETAYWSKPFPAPESRARWGIRRSRWP